MSAGRSDASTSTDDVKGRPLCLFYFTHPFGVLSPEPPRMCAAPASLFLNMEPVSPFYFTSTEESYGSSSPPPAPEPGGGPRRRDSVCSSLVSSEVWVSSSSGEWSRRALPYARMLPPLRLPSPRDLPDYTSDEVWPPRAAGARFSLPPLRLPPPRPALRALPPHATTPEPRAAPPEPHAAPAPREARSRRRHGVRKPRSRRGDVRRLLACLMRRAVRGGIQTDSRASVDRGRAARATLEPAPAEPRIARAVPRQQHALAGQHTYCGGGVGGAESPALREVLHVLRAAWNEPRPLADTCRTSLKRDVAPSRESALECSTRMSNDGANIERRDASPGLLRRRYSVPETIMRKYRLAQLCSESEETVSCSRYTAASACASPPREPSCSPSESPTRFLRGDREMMRKSTLLRRMWARPVPACLCCDEGRTSRSLAGSRSELLQPWTSPKRQRLDERPRPQRTTADFSDSTFQSHVRGASSCDDTIPDAFSDSEECRSVSRPPVNSTNADDHSFSDTDTISVSVPTTKQTVGSVDPVCRESFTVNELIESQVDDRQLSVHNEECRTGALPYDKPLTVETDSSPFETLEVVVSETVNTSFPMITFANHERASRVIDRPPVCGKLAQDMNIDEYVSSILVESLNSLTDQLECMNASIGNDRKISIVEKEIKVKLQNTGVNTIVHLSPTSNNQIIFGNEELCNDGSKDECNNPSELIIRDETESNNNVPCASSFNAVIQHDNINKSVLQQIQKLFQDEIHQLDSDFDYTKNNISHIEISNVDVYINEEGSASVAPADDDTGATLKLSERLISGVGAGNYFHDTHEAAVVPRFSAFPHTDSMEVNTSSSEDAEIISECTSLVDSLDDPNSPRSVIMRRSLGARRGELVRSAIDVLDLLPESVRGHSAHARDKGEAFFVRIKDDDCDCEKNDVKVSEYMPEKIKQRLFRRQRKRELRMESARRGRIKQVKRELEMRRQEDASRSRREVDRECRNVLNSLIEEIVIKIVQDEYKCMRIKQRNNKLKSTKSDEFLAKCSRRKEAEHTGNNNNDYKNLKSENFTNTHDFEKKSKKTENHQSPEKMLARPSVSTSGRATRRIYQKSEILEGDKCIEILEILEYVNGSHSSPETTNSDENLNQTSRKKSRIPIPVHEKNHRNSKNDCHMRLTGGDGRRTSPEVSSHRALTDMLVLALAEQRAEPRAPLPPADTRSRSNSHRFKRVFDIIPEERVDSQPDESALRTRSAATSPPAAPRPRSQTTMTEANTKSVATSPLRPNNRPSREGDKESVAISESKPTRKNRNERTTTGVGVTLTGPQGPHLTTSHRTRHTRSGSREETTRYQDEHGPIHKQDKCPKEWDKCPKEWDKLGECTSSDSGDSGGSLMCSLAPRWLSTRSHPRRRTRRAPARPPPDTAQPPQPTQGWSVTVAGSCRAALPADLEMRLRFPHERRGASPCACAHCARHALPPAAPPHEPAVTLTVKKEAQESSLVASKSLRKSYEQLPELETYRASRSKVKSTVKRRGCSLQCDPLAVLGCAIVPEHKPRVPTMSERDLTRNYTPRHYLRS